MQNKDTLNVLYLEDSEQDVELVRQKLMSDLACPVYLDWAPSEEEYVACVKSKAYDLILADYTLPGYNAESALQSALASCPDTPFICISGTIGEDTAVELLKQGATDYVLKDRLGRLAFAVTRAIHQEIEKEEYARTLRISEERKRNAIEFELKNKLITEFFTNVSHELKTPLSIILAQLELMGFYLDDSTKMYDLIATASQNAFRLTRLIGNILDITKIDAGFAGVVFGNVEVFGLIKSICDSVKSYAEAKSIRLACGAPQYGKVMPVDTEKMERILLNLLSNAIKFTAENGEINVNVEDRMDRGIVITVKDTGEGIAEDKLNSIFDRFAQADSSLARKNEGCGIGLALVKSLVEMLGGKITVESKVGEGSIFTVELPIVKTIPDTKINVYGFNLAKKAEMELSDLNLKH